MAAGDDPRLLLAPLRGWALTDEERPFLTFVDGDGATTALTYGAFYDRVRRLAAGLLDAGLRPGDRCVVHTGNTVGFLFAFWALQEVGAVAVPTIVQYTPDELRYVVEHAGAWGVVADATLLPLAREAVAGLDCRLIVSGGAATGSPEPGTLSLDALEASGDPARAPGGGRADDLALILYTSGTTSRPKGVMLGSAGTATTATAYANHLRLRDDDTVLTCMPLFHVNGMFLQMAPAIVAGARFVLTPRFSTSRYWEWVADHDVTVGHLIAGPLRLLLAAPEAPGDRAHRVRAMTHGLPLTDGELTAFRDRFGIALTMAWGLTETACGGTLMPLGVAARPGYQHVGAEMHDWEVRAADPDDPELQTVATGEVGELLVRGPGTMLGYYGDPEATAATLRDGWVRTGDLGYRDEIGYFHFVDRIKDMLKPSGENVAASEIERVIEEDPAVAECAVVGVPDPVRVERVIALVVPAEGAAPTVESVLARCRERLAGFKVPAVVELRAELPKTSIGKVRKGELRAELSAASAAVAAD